MKSATYTAFADQIASYNGNTTLLTEFRASNHTDRLEIIIMEASKIKLVVNSCEITLSRGLKSCLNSSYSLKQVIKTVSLFIVS